MSTIIGIIVLCVVGMYVLMWVCGLFFGSSGLYVACFLFVSLMFAMLVKIYIKQEEIQEKQNVLLKRLDALEKGQERTEEQEPS